MEKLTARELQLLAFVANGNSSKQTAHALGITEQTVKNAMSLIMRKLKANTRTHAVAMALTAGVVRLTDQIPALD